jgi:hypothetical protein
LTSNLEFETVHPKHRKASVAVKKALITGITGQCKLAVLADDTVTAGPRKRMRLLSSRDKASQLLGYYEQELHSCIETVIAWQPDVFVNVGCGEGYYAVGLAGRIPAAQSFAYNPDPFSQVACKLARDVNRVGVEVMLGVCTALELRLRTQNAERPFILMDCEGCERELLLDTQYSYPNARIIVECHDFIDRQITSALIDKFSASHQILVIKQGGRNPFGHPLTAGWAENDLWLLVSERRPERMHWLYMEPISR